MKKQLIERIAQEVLDSFKTEANDPNQTDREAIAEFAIRFLARVDGERGKDAYAWEDVDRFYTKNDPELSDHIRETATPLFLCPSVPARASLADAPACLNMNDKAMWVTGWNECIAAAI